MDALILPIRVFLAAVRPALDQEPIGGPHLNGVPELLEVLMVRLVGEAEDFHRDTCPRAITPHGSQ